MNRFNADKWFPLARGILRVSAEGHTHQSRTHRRVSHFLRGSSGFEDWFDRSRSSKHSHWAEEQEGFLKTLHCILENEFFGVEECDAFRMCLRWDKEGFDGGSGCCIAGTAWCTRQARIQGGVAMTGSEEEAPMSSGELCDLICLGRSQGLDCVTLDELRTKTGISNLVVLKWGLSEMLCNSPDTDDTRNTVNMRAQANTEQARMIRIESSRVTKKRIKARIKEWRGSSAETTLPKEAFPKETRLRDMTPEELVIDLRTNITSIELRIRDLVIDLMTTIYLFTLKRAALRGKPDEE